VQFNDTLYIRSSSLAYTSVPSPQAASLSIPNLESSNAGDTTALISFPTGSGIATGTLDGGTSLPTAEPTIDPNFSFITSQSELVFQTPSPSPSMTLTDPDQATTTIAFPDPSASGSVSQVPLPTGIPSRIYPQNGVSDSTDLSGYTLISLLFDSDLGWVFVVEHDTTSSQLFAYVPPLVQTALGISGTRLP
jgi:hypothetical protein